MPRTPATSPTRRSCASSSTRARPPATSRSPSPRCPVAGSPGRRAASGAAPMADEHFDTATGDDSWHLDGDPIADLLAAIDRVHEVRPSVLTPHDVDLLLAIAARLRVSRRG